MTNKHRILTKTRDYVKSILEKDSTGHDFWHIVRVTNTALEIAKHEKANTYIVELAALLHYIADEKLNVNETAGLTKVDNWLKKCGVETNDKDHVLTIITNMSFKHSLKNSKQLSLEGQTVQDADRLDALFTILSISLENSFHQKVTKTMRALLSRTFTKNF